MVLVPGYGGGTGGLDALAERIRATGRAALVVPLPGGGTGDLAEQADALDGCGRDALDAGAPSVDVIGYSAGGVVARLWVAATTTGDQGAPRGHARLAAPRRRDRRVGAAAVPGACPAACQQLAPGSRLLAELDTPVPTPPAWLSLWTVQDQTVTPPDSARLEGAMNVASSRSARTCAVDHSGLPTDPLVTTARAPGDRSPIRCTTPADTGPTAADDLMTQLLMSLVAKLAQASGQEHGHVHGLDAPARGRCRATGSDRGRGRSRPASSGSAGTAGPRRPRRGSPAPGW